MDKLVQNSSLSYDILESKISIEKHAFGNWKEGTGSVLSFFLKGHPFVEGLLLRYPNLKAPSPELNQKIYIALRKLVIKIIPDTNAQCHLVTEYNSRMSTKLKSLSIDRRLSHILHF